MSEFRNAEPDAVDDVRPKHSPLMSDQKDLAPASYKQKRSRTKKAPKASHSSLDNQQQQQPGAYRATADAARRSKERRTSRESRAEASSRADSSVAAGTTTTRTRATTTKGGGDGRNSKRRSKPRQPSMDTNHKQSKTSTRSNLTALESDKKAATPSRTSTMTPGPPSLDRQMYRHVEPGAQAIAGSQAHLHANDDDDEIESGYSFPPPDEPSAASKRDGVTVDLTEAHMVDDVEVYQDPVYAETVDVERQKLQERSNRRKYALWGFLAASLVAIGIALAVVFTRPDASATEAPSASPTVTDEFLPQFLQTLSDPADLNNATSPQARAYDWIVNEDEVVRTGNEAKIQQRYAMAVLFYSTNGETAWETNQTWLSVTKPICNWTQSGTNVCDDNGLLREFTMDRNGMLGTIPTELALLSQSLSVLDLTINKLHGSLPTELGAMTLLETLHVSTNQLTGTIPTELGLLTNVRQLYVDANNIMDTMPQVICDLKTNGGSLEKLWADCTNDTNVVADVQCEVGVCCRCCFGLVCQ